MPFTHINDSATVSTTEYFLAADSTTKALQTTECHLSAFVHVAGMALGDQFRVRLYREINNVEVVLEEFYLTYPRSAVGIPALAVGGASGAWDVSATRIAGADRTLHWTFVQST